MAVVSYHFDALVGGYLGVDLFFVLSGFLITSLLIVERDRSGTISLRSFWARRARRLLPALYATIAAGALYAMTMASESELPALRRDGIAGLFYVANWAQLRANAAYFDDFGLPSFFRHLWSLAIEEQFYLVWPLIAAGVLRLAKRPVRALGVVSAIGAALSLGAAIWMYRPEVTVERLYFGTDTRVGAILIGAYVACLSAAPRSENTNFDRQRHPRGAALVRTVASTGALLWLGLCWALLEGTDPLLWRGGLALCGVSAAVLIGIVGSEHPGGLGRALSVRPLLWFGSISYGLYLWHWPVRVVLDESRIAWRGVSLFALRFVVSVALAAVSYYLLEMPIRRGTWSFAGLRRSAGGSNDRPSPSERPGRQGAWPLIAAVASSSLLVAGLLTWATRPPQLTATVAEALDEAQSRATSNKAATPGLLPATTPLRIVVMGDSVGANIGTGMSALAEQRGFESRSIAKIGCPLSLTRGRNKDTNGWIEDDARCAQILNTFDEVQQEFSPNLVIASFGAATDFDRELPSGAISNPCSADYDAWRAQQLDGLFSHLQRADVAVAATTVAYLRKYGASDVIDKQTDCLNATLRTTAAKYGVAVIELGRWTCPSAIDCIQTLGGLTLRPDGLHYNEQLGPVVSNWILSQVVTGWTVDRNDSG